MRALTFSLLLVVMVSIIGLGWALDHLFTNMTHSRQTDEIADYRLFAAQLAKTLDAMKVPIEFVQHWPASSELPLSLQNNSNFPLPENIQRDFKNGEPLILESESGLSMNYYLPRHNLVLTINPVLYQKAGVTPLQGILTTLFYGGILALILVWLYPLLRKLYQLRTAAAEFGAGNLEKRIDTQGISYIGDIENEFNRMAQRIQTLVEDNKLLSSAVSHDLRTPLARLRFGVDTLADCEDSATQKKYLSRINNDLDEMEKLVSSLLNFARLDHTLIATSKDQVNLATLAEECIAQFHDEAHTIQQVTSPQNDHTKLTLINGSADYLAMALNNLIQNALQHGKSQVLISTGISAQSVTLQVSDDGGGIPEQQRQNVMKPFRRGQPEQSTDGNPQSSQSGYGLGLAIVGRIAHWHGASINIDDCPILKGARITINFSAA